MLVELIKNAVDAYQDYRNGIDGIKNCCDSSAGTISNALSEQL